MTARDAAAERDRFAHAIRALDHLQSEDPQRETVDGVHRPAAVVYSERMSAWVDRLAPEASEALRLAARCQHLRRWERPRADYPPGRDGYLRWRRDAQRHHAELAGRVLAEHGYTEREIARVAELLSKRRLKADPETQTLEDAACLVFLEHGLADFASRYEREKVQDVLRKTWRKMSPEGREAALRLPLGALAETVVEAVG